MALATTVSVSLGCVGALPHWSHEAIFSAEEKGKFSASVGFKMF